jgi:hypothetical protein
MDNELIYCFTSHPVSIDAPFRVMSSSDIRPAFYACNMLTLSYNPIGNVLWVRISSYGKHSKDTSLHQVSLIRLFGNMYHIYCTNFGITIMRLAPPQSP